MSPTGEDAMDNVADALSAQRGTSPLTQYNGNGPVGLDPREKKLQELLAAIESMLANLPPDIAAMLQGVIGDAEALLSGGSITEIEQMIERLKQIIQTLMQLISQLQSSTGGQQDLSQLQSTLSALGAELDPSARAAITMLMQQLRKLAVGNSLKGVDEVNLGSLDGSSLVDPTQSNVVLSLQQLITMAMGGGSAMGSQGSSGNFFDPASGSQAAILQAGATAAAISALPPPGN